MFPHWTCRFVGGAAAARFGSSRRLRRLSCPANCLGGRAKNSSNRARRCRSRAAPVVSLPSTVAPEGAEKLMVTVRGFRITGSTIYSAEDLEPLYRDIVGREVPVTAIYDLAQRITAKYGGDGYVLSRAIVPPQELSPRGVCRAHPDHRRLYRPGRMAAGAGEVPRLLLGLCGEDHRRAADQRQDARALPAAGKRPPRPAVHQQPEGLAEQSGRRDAGGRGGGEAARRIRPRRQPRHQGTRPATVFQQHQPQQSRARARKLDPQPRPARSS